MAWGFTKRQVAPRGDAARAEASLGCEWTDPGGGVFVGDGQASSLLRLYAGLGRADSYRAIMNALRPGLESVLGYRCTWLALAAVPGGDLGALAHWWTEGAVGSTASQTDADSTALLMVDTGGPVEQAMAGASPEEPTRIMLHCEEFLVVRSRDDAFLTEVLKARQPLVAADASADPRTNKEFVVGAGIATLVGVPLLLEERMLGILGTGTFVDDGVRLPDTAQLALLQALAAHVAIAIDRVRILGERRAAEEAFHKSEERYRRFVETAADGVWAQNEDGVIAYASDRMAALLACDPRSMQGRLAGDFVFDEDLGTYEELIERRRQGLADTSELRLRRTDGSPVWLLMSGTPIIDEAGEFRGSFAMMTDISGRKSAELERERLVAELHDMLDGVVVALSGTTSERDPYTALHQNRVSRLAVAIAREMGLDDGFVEGLQIAALLHDIGKIVVPAEILSKPARLSDFEMGIVRTHPTVGYRLLEGVNFRRPVARIVLQHHERLDGSGYPDGLPSEEVLPEAKILAVADVVEAMASHRPYRAALSLDAAIDEIETGAGTRYDPDVVAACVALFRGEAPYEL